MRQRGSRNTLIRIDYDVIGGNGSQKGSQRGSQKESFGSQKGSHLGQVNLVFNVLLN